jgi:hypothetical protein
MAPLPPTAQVAQVGMIQSDEYVQRKSALNPTPSLLAALRAVPDLYWEALEVFYAINYFVLDITTFRRFIILKPDAVRLVKCLFIDLR